MDLCIPSIALEYERLFPHLISAERGGQLLNSRALNTRFQEWALREAVMEKDCVIGWVLWGIGPDALPCDFMVLQGQDMFAEVLP